MMDPTKHHDCRSLLYSTSNVVVKDVESTNVTMAALMTDCGDPLKSKLMVRPITGSKNTTAFSARRAEERSTLLKGFLGRSSSRARVNAVRGISTDGPLYSWNPRNVTAASCVLARCSIRQNLRGHVGFHAS
jgi:hypothetical protein